MYSMFPQYPPIPQIPQNKQPQLKGRLVGSVQEVQTTQIELDGTPFIFPDLANDRIYVKCLENNGMVMTRTYKLVEGEDVQPQAFATKGDIEALRKELEAMRGGVNNVSASNEQNSADTTTSTNS